MTKAYVKARKTDEFVTAGCIYPVVSLHDGMVEFQTPTQIVTIDAEDTAFEVILNREGVVCGCDCCAGDLPVAEVGDTRVFVDETGHVLFIAGDVERTVQVKYCPMCGRHFGID